MKTSVTLFAIAVVFLCSCTKTPDAELEGEFKGLEAWVDMTQSNKYNESLFCKSWVCVGVIEEEYVDGQLKRITDRGNDSVWSDYVFRENHTFSSYFQDSKSRREGTWLYSHNYLLLVSGGSRVMEVMYADKRTLRLRDEIVPAGAPFSLFFDDPSGRHLFWVYEFSAK